MILIRCPDCGERISKRAPFCPHCGAAFRLWWGWGYEYKSTTTLWGWPLVHIAWGRDPETGKLRIAKGIIAIGQFALGFFTIAQFGISIIFELGQFILGATAIAQFAIAFFFGLRQFATGYIAIAQIALGYYVLGQFGLGKFVWAMNRHDAQAFRFFQPLLKLTSGK